LVAQGLAQVLPQPLSVTLIRLAAASPDSMMRMSKSKGSGSAMSAVCGPSSVVVAVIEILSSS
jgi:hypothetical protein